MTSAARDNNTMQYIPQPLINKSVYWKISSMNQLYSLSLWLSVFLMAETGGFYSSEAICCSLSV